MRAAATHDNRTVAHFMCSGARAGPYNYSSLLAGRQLALHAGIRRSVLPAAIGATYCYTGAGRSSRFAAAATAMRHLQLQDSEQFSCDNHCVDRHGAGCVAAALVLAITQNITACLAAAIIQHHHHRHHDKHHCLSREDFN